MLYIKKLYSFLQVFLVFLKLYSFISLWWKFTRTSLENLFKFIQLNKRRIFQFKWTFKLFRTFLLLLHGKQFSYKLNFNKVQERIFYCRLELRDNTWAATWKSREYSLWIFHIHTSEQTELKTSQRFLIPKNHNTHIQHIQNTRQSSMFRQFLSHW